MQLLKDIISIVQELNTGFTFVAPYQENAPDFNKGYATVFKINEVTQIWGGEKPESTDLTLWNVTRILVQFSFYKFVNYNDDLTPDSAAIKLSLLIRSFDTMKAFNKVGLDVGKVEEIITDTYRDDSRNKYVQHAHFEATFYKKEIAKIESGIFERITIENEKIIDGGPNK